MILSHVGDQFQTDTEPRQQQIIRIHMLAVRNIANAHQLFGGIEPVSRRETKHVASLRTLFRQLRSRSSYWPGLVHGLWSESCKAPLRRGAD